jgi:outer membrane protein OmpA-like peptidoglycan-associated protein
MKKKFLLILSLICLVSGIATAADQPIEVTLPSHTADISHQSIDGNSLLVTVTDDNGDPIQGLTREDFIIRTGNRKTNIISVETLEENRKVGLNIVAVIDNSASMHQRNAIKPLLSAMETFFKIVRPIDNITLILFDDRHAIKADDYHLHVKTLKSNNVDKLRGFLNDGFSDKGLTDKTVLYEAMIAGLHLIKQMPEKENKFLVVFSDGKDLNSAYKTAEVMDASRDIYNFEAYAVDYMPGPELDPFLTSFSNDNGGQIWKASSATDLLPIFESFSTRLFHRYVVTYGFLSMAPAHINIEEITTIDSAPLLNYVYFETGKSNIPEKYVLFKDQAEAGDFDESRLKKPMEKYRHVLNIFGKRLKAHPEAKVTLTGCNAHYGKERGKRTLSKARAEAVKVYLQNIWGIEPERMTLKARNRPVIPSTSRIEEGRVENQRVEIHSESPEIMDTVKSTYLEAASDVPAITATTDITGLNEWRLALLGDGEPFHEMTGEGNLNPEYTFALDALGFNKVGTYETVRARLDADHDGRKFQIYSDNHTTVKYIKRDERLAQKMGIKVLEKYALILFDYDSAAIKARNRIIVDRIIKRMKEIPNPTVSIVGHTDIIGKEDYNKNLSERRARAVYDQMIGAGMAAGDHITFKGVGPDDPLYDNDLPEGRALNRTVTVELSYEQSQ